MLFITKKHSKPAYDKLCISINGTEFILKNLDKLCAELKKWGMDTQLVGAYGRLESKEFTLMAYNPDFNSAQCIIMNIYNFFKELNDKGIYYEYLFPSFNVADQMNDLRCFIERTHTHSNKCIGDFDWSCVDSEEINPADILAIYGNNIAIKRKDPYRYVCDKLDFIMNANRFAIAAKPKGTVKFYN